MVPVCTVIKSRLPYTEVPSRAFPARAVSFRWPLQLIIYHIIDKLFMLKHQKIILRFHRDEMHEEASQGGKN